MRHFLAAFLFALPLVAQTSNNTIQIDPVAPTSVTPIEVRVLHTCGIQDVVVERAGSVIKVTAEILILCSPPIWRAYTLTIDPLPPGEYRLELHDRELDRFDSSMSFVVRNGEKQAFTVHPFAVRASADGLRMFVDSTGNKRLCHDFADGCPGMKVRVGGALAANVKEENGDSMSFDAPRLGPGLYDVTLENHDGEVSTLSSAVYYFDEPDPSVFERILFPILEGVSGAHGSEWVSEAVIVNPRPWPVENVNSIFPYVCLGYPCGERLSPREHTSFEGFGYPQGVALLAPRPDAKDLVFSLRVRDTSRDNEGLGTEVPVVREKNMFRNASITLLDVPLDPRYRVKIRMYAFEPFVYDHVWGVVTTSSKGTRTVDLIGTDRQCSACAHLPDYLELNLPVGAQDETATIYLTPPQESFAWAFASVTNNATQQVTIVTPNGEGGEP